MAQQKDAKLDVWVYKGWHSKVPQLHGLNGRNLFSHSSAGQKFVIQVSARVASPETSFYLLWMTVFSPYLYIVFLLYIYFCVYTSLVALVVKKKPACQCRRHRKHGFYPWVGKIPWRRAWPPTPVFLPGESHGSSSHGGAWWATVHRVTQSRTQLKGLSKNACTFYLITRTPVILDQAPLHDFILAYFPLQRPYIQMESHAQVLGVGTYGSGEAQLGPKYPISGCTIFDSALL